MRRIVVLTAAGGLIATVVGGVILDVIPRLGEVLAKVLSGASSGISWVWTTLGSSYSMPGWALVVVGVLALIGLISVGILVSRPILRRQEHPHRGYIEDEVDGVVWRWRWSGNRIYSLWCYCPRCDAQLVYNDDIAQTQFICERCPSDGSLTDCGSRGRILLTVEGGNKDYAVSATQREIRRRIRTGQV